jgi:vancomycin resistance protein YoaR
MADIEPARIITPENSEYAFPTRLSIGLSNYATSSEDRIHNVKLGLNKVHNRVVLPGETFNFNEMIIPVTNEAGWKNELAIFGGGGLAKVPGGGLCQVSTTVYRAFFNGGFNVLERFPHSLYVHYYTAYQDGLDATIYPAYGDQKGKNLRVQNDTPNPILIQTYTNDETLDAMVQIFGTSDGREVTITGPKYGKDTWIGTDYIEDPSLPSGYEKIEANGAYGKTIIWDRKIVYADGVVNNEELFSRYNAKKKVVRVGTGF